MSEYQFITIHKIEKPDLTIHCVQSPDFAEMVNAQIIETEKSLLVIDVTLLRPVAHEFRSYVDSLGKPVKQVIITHAHPDHWFGLEFFKDLPTFALEETIQEITQKGDYLLGYHRSLHGEKAPEMIANELVIPKNKITNFSVNVDGVTLNLQKLTDTETQVLLVADIPQYKILLAQDLIYNGVYLFVGDKTATGELCFDSWTKALQEQKQKGYETIIPGHGLPTDQSVFDADIEYLKFVKEKFSSGIDPDGLKAAIQSQYPDYKVQLMLDMSNYFLYNMQG